MNKPIKSLFILAILFVFGFVTTRFYTPTAQAATTVINVCSQNSTSSYNILGGATQDLRAKLDNLANFGPTGAYGDYDFAYINVSDNFTEQTILNNSCDIWFSGFESDSTYTITELTQLQNWVANNNGQVIAGCDASSHDPVCNLLNFTVTTDTDTYGFLTNTAINPINCDGSLGPGDQLEMAGGAGGYFSGSGVTASNVLAVHETNGAPNSNKPIVVYTGNFFLTADINMITLLGLSTGSGVTNNNDILTMNAFSALADVAIGVAVCSSAAPDSDNDGVPDIYDAFPLNPNESVDTDGDGIGNNADPDDDNDGQSDSDEIACGSNPLDANSTSPDSDGDNIPNCVDTVGPTLYVADANLDASSGSISVPVLFTSNGASISSLGFSIDYDQSCLSYNTISGFPSGYVPSVSHAAGDSDGELDISLFDQSTPLNALSNGPIATIAFTVNPACVTTNGTTVAAAVNFSNAPAASFGDTNGDAVSGTATGGTLTLRFNATPTAITLGNGSVDENVAVGTLVGNLSTSDVDSSDSHTYSFVAGTGDTDNGSFTLDGSQLKINVSPDFETQPSYSLRLRSTDSGGLFVEQAFTITVNDLYEAPASINFGAAGGGDDGDPNTLDINENKAAGSTVATFSPGNPNTGSTYTFELVAGTGAADNGSFSFNGNELQTNVPLDAEQPGGYTIRVKITDNLGNSFEQIFIITVNNLNDAPVAVDDLIDPVAQVLVGAAALDIDVLANDSDEDGDTLAVAALTQPAAGSAAVNGANVTFTAPNRNGSTSFTYQATDGALNSGDATVTVTYVKNDPRGDCNGNGGIDAGDFSAIALEFFDTDTAGDRWYEIYQQGYVGSPIGCDANASKNGSAPVNNPVTSVTPADIICTVLVFFGNTSCTNGTVVAASEASGQVASLQVAGVTADAGETVQVPVVLASSGSNIAAAGFTLNYDAASLSFDASDANGDGLPDALALNLPAGVQAWVQVRDGQIQVALAGLTLPLPTLTDGALATATFSVTGSNSTVHLTNASLGDTNGASVAVTTTDGTVGTAISSIFLPLVAR